jgi:hypothetical protein
MSNLKQRKTIKNGLIVLFKNFSLHYSIVGSETGPEPHKNDAAPGTLMNRILNFGILCEAETVTKTSFHTQKLTLKSQELMGRKGKFLGPMPKHIPKSYFTIFILETVPLNNNVVSIVK